MIEGNLNQLYELLNIILVLGAVVLDCFLSQLKLVKPKLKLDFENDVVCMRRKVIRLKCPAFVKRRLPFSELPT